MHAVSDTCVVLLHTSSRPACGGATIRRVADGGGDSSGAALRMAVVRCDTEVGEAEGMFDRASRNRAVCYKPELDGV